jgi:hypothetical protein
MRLFPVVSLVSVFGCAAPQPSTVPLGGEEWVKPARHVDRRPPGESEANAQLADTRSTPPPVRAEPALPRPVAKPVEAAPATAKTNDVRFELIPFTVGNTITLDGRLTLKATITMNLQGTTSSQSIEFEAEQQLNARVTEVRGRDVIALEVEYVKRRSVFRMPGMDPEEDSSAGKRYRVTVQGRNMRVEALGATLAPDEDKEVQRDLAAVIGYLPIVQPRLPASLTPGWRYDVSDGDLTTLFASAPSARFSGGKLSFQGTDLAAPDRARFGCGVSVQFEKDGATVGSDLEGTCIVRPSDARPIQLDLKGDLRADTPLPFGADSTVTGTVELAVKQSYGSR